MVRILIDVPEEELIQWSAFLADTCELMLDPVQQRVELIREFFYNDGFDARETVHIQCVASVPCPHGRCTMSCEHPENGLGVCTNPWTQVCGLVSGKST